MGTAVVQKLKSSFNDPNLPTIGGLVMPFTRSGATTTIATIKIGIDTTVPTAGVTLRFDSITQGEFFSDSAGTTSLGYSVNYNTSGEKTLYCKTYINGTLRIDNAEYVSGLGPSATVDWSPTYQFVNGSPIVFNNVSIDQFASLKRCKKLMLGNGAAFSGDISVFSYLPLLTGIHIGSASAGSLTGSFAVFKNLPLMLMNVAGLATVDVGKLPNTLKLFSVNGVALQNTGSSSDPAITGPLYAQASISSSVDSLTTSEADALIQSFAATLLNPTPAMNITLKGSRSNASDAAVTTLASKGYTVVMN